MSNLTEVKYVGENHEWTVLTLDPARGLNFDGLKLHRAWLNNQNLAGATFRGANVSGAFFHGCNLTGADFTGANLITADLGEADLRNAILKDCKAYHVMLYEADLRGADLTGCQGPLNAKGARYDSATRWPEGVDLDALEAIFCEEES